MKYIVNEKKDGKVEVDFNIPAKEWEEAVEATYQKNKGKYKKEGFRQGKIPRKVLEQTYGEYMFYEDAFNDIFPVEYSIMIKKEKELNPVDYPEISLTRIDATGVQFKAIITLMPEVKLGKYKGIKIEKNKVEVTEAEVKKSLKEKAESQARFVSITDRPVKKGDLINLDYSGSVDSVKFSGGTAKNQELEIGSNTFIPGFEESLIGAELLKDIDVKVKFPEDYHAMDLAGKDAIFACKVLEIREKQVPKIDDVFASEVSEFSTLEELKKSITEKTLKTKSENANRDAENKLIETIVKNAEIDIPESMIERQIDALVDDISEKLSAQGLKFDDYLKYIGSDNDAYRKTQRKQADAMVRTSLVFEAIVSTEKIEVLKEDFDAKIAEMAKTMEKSVTEIKKEMKGKQKDVIENNILSEKVINFVKENNTIK